MGKTFGTLDCITNKSNYVKPNVGNNSMAIAQMPHGVNWCKSPQLIVLRPYAPESTGSRPISKVKLVTA